MRNACVVGVAAILAACGGSSPTAGAARSCETGAIESCEGDGGGPGLRACGADGRWRACAALVVQPEQLDFGTVAPGPRVEATVAVTYPGEGAIPIRSATIEDGTPFRLVAAPDRLPGNGVAALFVISFEPRADGASATNRLRIDLDVPGLAPLEVPLSGRSWLSCERSELDFGEVIAGGGLSLGFLCRNLGLGSLHIDAVGVSTDQADDFEVEEPRPGTRVRGGESFQVRVLHHAEGTRDVEGSLVIGFADPPGRLDIPLRAHDRYGTCSLAIATPDLRLLPGGIAGGSIELTSTGEGACHVRAVHALVCDEGFEFAWPVSFDVAPTVQLPVTVRADHDGVVRCVLELDVESPAAVPPITLEARVGWKECLESGPQPVEFEARAGSCPGPVTVDVRNACWDPVAIADVAIEGAASFTMDATPDLPIELIPGASVPIPMTFRPREAGSELAELVLLGPDGARVQVPLLGIAQTRATVADTWETGPMPGLDLLAVVDNGTGMAAEADRVLAALGPLPDVLRGKFDYHLAVTTSSLVPSASCGGPAAGGERGRFVPIDGSRPRVVTPETPDARAVWEANLAVGACHDGPNEALEAARLALDTPLADHEDDPASPEPADGNAGFYRRDAYLGLVFVGDREDASPRSNGEYLNTFLAKKGLRDWAYRFFAWAIAGDPGTGCTGPAGEAAAADDRWSWLAGHTDFGASASICSVEAPLPIEFGGRRRCFYLWNTPSDFDGDGALTDAAGELRVRVNGSPVPSTDDAGGTVWSTAELTDSFGIAGFCFAAGHEPDWNSTVEAEYVVCQP